MLPLSPFSICNGAWHPLYSTYVLDSPHVQPLSRYSLVFPLVLNPQLHAPYISSPSHRHLFATHDRTSAACSAAKPMLCHLPLVSLSAPYLGVSFSLTPHIHLTILISACRSATTFSFLTGQVSLPCNMLLLTQLLYNLTLIIRDTDQRPLNGRCCCLLNVNRSKVFFDWQTLQ